MESEDKNKKMRRGYSMGTDGKLKDLSNPDPDPHTLQEYLNMPYTNFEGAEEPSAKNIENCTESIMQTLRNYEDSDKTVGEALFQHWNALETANCWISGKGMREMCNTYVIVVRNLELVNKFDDSVRDLDL